MTPEQAIADLDRELVDHGSTFTLVRRQNGAVDLEWTIKGFMRDLKPSEITDGIGQGARRLAISPTSLVGSPFEIEALKRGDFALSQARRFAVEAVDAVLLADTVVRFNLTVKG